MRGMMTKRKSRLVLTAAVCATFIGCGRDPDAIGEGGIGAAGTVNASVSEEEAQKAQMKLEADNFKASQKAR